MCTQDYGDEEDDEANQDETCQEFDDRGETIFEELGEEGSMVSGRCRTAADGADEVVRSDSGVTIC